MTERLVKWYNDKIAELAPMHSVYLTSSTSNIESFVHLSRQNWSTIIDTLYAIEKEMVTPYALGDQISLADLHLTAWLARLFAVACQVEQEKDEIVALQKALQHDCLKENIYAKLGLSDKVSREGSLSLSNRI